MDFGQLKPHLDQIARSLRILSEAAQDNSHRDTIHSESNTDVPKGYKYLKVVKTNGTGTVVIALDDGGNYTLTAQGDYFELPTGGKLPAFEISTSNGGTWTWTGTK